MQANRLVTVAVTAVCLLLGALSISDAKEFEPSEAFDQADEIVFATWEKWAGFKGTKEAIELMIKELKESKNAGQELGQKYESLLQDLETMVELDNFKEDNCVDGEYLNIVKNFWDKYPYCFANLDPYLTACLHFQQSLCFGEMSRGEPAIHTPAYPHGLSDNRAMPKGGYTENDIETCDAKCLLKEIGLKEVLVNESEDVPEQTKLLLERYSFRNAMRIVFGEDLFYHEHYPMALRQIRNELNEAEARDGQLSPLMERIKKFAETMLDVCKPDKSTCDSVFNKMADAFPDYENLNDRKSMKDYARQCLYEMTLFCSYTYERPILLINEDGVTELTS